ncbi:MAG TPA: hypothetical protein VGE57_11245 [Solimonas sp.]
MTHRLCDDPDFAHSIGVAAERGLSPCAPDGDTFRQARQHGKCKIVADGAAVPSIRLHVIAALILALARAARSNDDASLLPRRRSALRAAACAGPPIEAPLKTPWEI